MKKSCEWDSFISFRLLTISTDWIPFLFKDIVTFLFQNANIGADIHEFLFTQCIYLNSNGNFAEANQAWHKAIFIRHPVSNLVSFACHMSQKKKAFVEWQLPLSANVNNGSFWFPSLFCLTLNDHYSSFVKSFFCFKSFLKHRFWLFISSLSFSVSHYPEFSFLMILQSFTRIHSPLHLFHFLILKSLA